MGLEKEDIMALIAILQKGLEDEKDPQIKKVGSKKRTTQTTKSKSVAVVSNNKFDSMSEKDLHKQDTEIDKKLWGNNRPTERSRQSSVVSVRCRVCGKTEQVSAMIIDSAERYKCNKCATTSG
jgi:hypothetical protein